MDKTTRNKQPGFTLVTVLILMVSASILVVHSLKDNVTQERLSGNFQKKINARLLAEKGVFSAYNQLNQLLLEDPSSTIAELIAASNNGQLEGSGSLSDTHFNVALTQPSTGELELTSVGKRYEGESTLKANFILVGGGGSYPFSDMVIGCEGVTLNGSGKVDSYDSSQGNYSAAIASNHGDVSTIEPNADVTLNGHAPIHGDVSSTGKVHLGGSSPVFGNIHASGDVYISQANVTGYVLTAGNFEQKGGTISGYVRANGDAAMDWGAKIDNENNFGLDILYGGSGVFKDTNNNSQYVAAQYNVNPNVARVPEHNESAPDYDPKDPATNCDPLDITSEVAKIALDTSSLPALTIGSGDIYNLTPTIGQYSAGGSGIIYPQSNNQFAEAFKTASVKLSSDGIISVSGGDVILYVAGNFSMAGNAQMSIASDSSLTIILTGKFSVAGSAGITANQQGLTSSSKRPALSVYSSFSGVNGVSISGSSDIYAAIYAPLSNVKVVGSGNIFGSVRAKKVTVSGGAHIHYDQALQGASNGSLGSTAGKLVLKSLQYF